jgi:hypothetical protein
MRVLGSLLPAEGDAVSISGIMSTDGGERVLVGADALVLSSSNPLPRPLGIVGRLLGGGPFGAFSAGVTGGFGVQNLGLLVRTYGKVTQIGTDYLYIDDGANLKDGTLTGSEEDIGVRVMCNPTGYITGDLVAATGISSCFETPSGSIARRVLTRRTTDMQKL